MIGKTALGATYHLRCQAVPVNRGRQHNYGKVTRKKEKRNFRSITTAGLISQEQNE